MSTLSVRAICGLAVAGLVTTTAVATATAEESAPPTAAGTVVASGLDNPRQLVAAPNGDLYVAESGTGGVSGTDCVQVPEGAEVCGNLSGAVTLVSRKGGQERVVTGLPSVGSEGETAGPSSVALRGSTLMVTVGMGGPPALGDLFTAAHGEAYATLATLQEVRLKGHGAPRLSTAADLGAYEATNNPHPAALDTNPNSVAADGSGWILADAGGNDVLRLDNRGTLSTVAVLPDGLAPAPPFLELPPGTQLPFEAVPTAAERGPDGAIYVSQLTGFPFPVGGSSIWRIGADGVPEQWATGLTNVTDLSFDKHGDLYAVQIADEGLLAGPVGSLVRVGPGDGDLTTVADDLFAPYAVALDRGYAYVTTGAVLPGAGQVVRFDLGG